MPEWRHGLQAHVAAADCPFVILLQQDRTGEADDRRVIGEDGNHLVRRLISPFTHSSGLVELIMAQ